MKEIFEICDDVTVFRDGRFIVECPVSELQKDRLVEMMVGCKLKAQYLRLKLPRGENVPTSQHLTGPGGNDASFTLYRGEILGVAGLMGAGRTKLIKIIYGAVPRTAGSVTLDGHEIIADSPQDGLVLGMSVKENMSLTALRHFSRAGGSLKQADEQAGGERFHPPVQYQDSINGAVDRPALRR